MYDFHSLKKGQIMRGHEHTIEEIELRYTEIDIIENGIFDDFTSLKVLSIKASLLKSINESILTEKLGETLMELNLEDTYRHNISLTAFKYLKKLEKLSLSWNYEIKTPLKKKLFSKSLTNLKSLTLKVFMRELDDDLFDNLVNLEELFLHGHALTWIPKAFNGLPNLRILDFGGSKISTFNNENFTTTFAKLETLKMSFSYNLKVIEDCAFCPFPNLTEIDLSRSANLEFIHENAFGNIAATENGTKTPKIKKFYALRCKLSTLSENLINWDSANEISIEGNPFICNCSMSWLINDYANLCPKYVTKLLSLYYFANDLSCAGPTKMEGKTFEQISAKNCATNFTTSAILPKYPNCTKKVTTPTPFKNYNYSDSNTRHDFGIALFVLCIFVVGIVMAIICSIFYCRRRKRMSSTNMQEAINKLNEDLTMSTFVNCK